MVLDPDLGDQIDADLCRSGSTKLNNTVQKAFPHRKRMDGDWTRYLAHEVNSSLGFVEGGGGHVNVEHHLPLAGPHRLVEAKPNLAPSAQRVVVPLGAERDTGGLDYKT